MQSLENRSVRSIRSKCAIGNNPRKSASAQQPCNSSILASMSLKVLNIPPPPHRQKRGHKALSGCLQGQRLNKTIASSLHLFVDVSVACSTKSECRFIGQGLHTSSARFADALYPPYAKKINAANEAVSDRNITICPAVFGGCIFRTQFYVYPDQ